MEWVGNYRMAVVRRGVLGDLAESQFLLIEGILYLCLQRSDRAAARSSLDALIDAHRRWRYETGEKAAVGA